MKLLQPSFGGGEYAPALWGRVDLARFGISARTMRNWIPRATGGMEMRPGTVYCDSVKHHAKAFRMLSFVVSESLSYVIELGDQYARFYFRGALLKGGDGMPVEIATPWTEAQIWDVRHTQSADAMFMFHGNHPPQILRRTGPATFGIGPYQWREGPFRNVNGDEARLLAASGATGNVTLESNFDLFSAEMVGSLVSLEPRSLGNVKPWAQGERTPNLAVGVQRTSDGKFYRATTVPNAGGSGNYTEAGNVRPTHETGREWDGPGDLRSLQGGVSWIVGVEWEYLHSGYGIVEITEFTDARYVKAVVRKTLPPEVVGGVGTPGNTWRHTGDGSAVTFAIAGASSASHSSYTVSINGVPVQSDPNYQPPPSGGGGGGGRGRDEYNNWQIL